MTRQEIKRFYENKIDDIQDEETKNRLLDKLEEVDDIILELDTEIEEELENQVQDYVEDEIQGDYNFYLEVTKK